MLALETGWTPDVIGELPVTFRAACHWALLARALVGPNGIPAVDIPKGTPVEDRLELLKLRVDVARFRSGLFPEDADV